MSSPCGCSTKYLYPGEMDRYIDRLNEAAGITDVAEMRPYDDEDRQDEE